jgi:hypothetical protein
MLTARPNRSLCTSRPVRGPMARAKAKTKAKAKAKARVKVKARAKAKAKAKVLLPPFGATTAAPLVE